MSTECESWSDVKERLEGGKTDLLLGNGFSLMFDYKFSYNILFQYFIDGSEQHNGVNSEFKDLFEEFGKDTTNFEHILKILDYACKTNKCLGLSTDKIEVAKTNLKQGLIETISANDFDKDKIKEPPFKEKKDVIIEKINTFNDIYTTNYDSLLYRIIMNIPKNEDRNSDVFNKEGNSLYATFDPINEEKNRQSKKKIYYLHGALFIYEKCGETRKLISSSDGLYNRITELINSDHFPLFIAEGFHKQKKDAIYRNKYLRYCFDKLKGSENPLLIFGNSLSVEDDHIVEAFVEKPRVIIVAIHNKNKSKDQVTELMLNIKNNFNKKSKNNSYPKEIYFVKSDTVFP